MTIQALCNDDLIECMIRGPQKETNGPICMRIVLWKGSVVVGTYADKKADIQLDRINEAPVLKSLVKKLVGQKTSFVTVSGSQDEVCTVEWTIKEGAIKKILKTVTITGADDSIKPDELIILSRDYPYVEWGILLSQDGFGNKRFPSREWICNLLELKKEYDINISGHICGSWIKDLVVGLPTFFDEFGHIYNSFERFQLNFHAEPLPVNFGKMGDTLRRYLHSKRILFQIDGVNDVLYNHLNGRCDFQIFPFFDTSHGAGIVPETWPIQPNMKYAGYGGGLSPENFLIELERICRVAQGPIWIDVETGVRSGKNGKYFDVDKVRLFLKSAEPFIIS